MARSKLKAHVVLFSVGSICLALHSSGWKVFVLQRVVLFRSRASSGIQTNQIWQKFDISDVRHIYIIYIYRFVNFPTKIVFSKMKESSKRIWKCLFPVWKQRLRDTQIFRRITNNRFMQVSCKVFTALRRESRGTEENKGRDDIGLGNFNWAKVSRPWGEGLSFTFPLPWLSNHTVTEKCYSSMLELLFLPRVLDTRFC